MVTRFSVVADTASFQKHRNAQLKLFDGTTQYTKKKIALLFGLVKKTSISLNETNCQNTRKRYDLTFEGYIKLHQVTIASQKIENDK